MPKILALNINGEMTYCTAPEDMRGKGRCNHIAHQKDGETPAQFAKRTENFDASDFMEKKPFIPFEGTEIVTKPYRMTEEEKSLLMKIENRIQLDQNIEGGYIELEEPLWNDMDKNYFFVMSGISVKKIDQVLHRAAYIVINSDIREYPEGRIITPQQANQALSDGVKIEVGTGVQGINKYAEEVYGWQATKDIYVLPYYMRIGHGSDISSDITIGYKYLIRNHKNIDRQQIAYEALLDNSKLDKEKARYTNGYRNKSLSDEFVGKGGVFRACLSGSSIPYSARSVVTPSTDINYGEIKIPPAIAVDIYKPTILKSLSLDGYNEYQINEYFAACRVPQIEVREEIRKDLEKRISNKRVCMNRQPSLHTSSFQSFKPLISENATTQVHPLYCESYGMDFDGDCVSLYGINSDSIISTVDKALDSKNYINTHKPRNIEASAILPSKDALFGLLNILDKRTN